MLKMVVSAGVATVKCNVRLACAVGTVAADGCRADKLANDDGGGAT